MWTTSNSRAELLRLIAVALVAGGCATSQGEGNAPDEPRPRRAPAVVTPTADEGQPAQDTPLEIGSVRLRPVRGDTLLERLAGPERMRPGAQPVAIDVVTATPLGNVARDAAVEIYLDGVPVGDSWPLPPNRIVGFVPDHRSLRSGMSVSLAWRGDEDRTRSRRRVALTQDQLREVQ